MTVEDFTYTLIATEQEYVEVLGTIVSFVQNLRKANIPDLTDEMIAKIFLNIESIYTFNLELLDELNQLYNAASFEFELGRTLTTFAPFFKLYGIYINNQAEAQELYRKVGSVNDKFLNYVEAYVKQSGFRFSALTELPSFRLQQYLVYLAAFIAILEATDYEYYGEAIQDLNAATQQIQSTIDIITQKYQDMKSREAVVKMQVEVFNNKVQIVDPSRYIIRKGQLELVYPEKSFFRPDKEKHYLALFNDLLLIVAVSGELKTIMRNRALNLEIVPDNVALNGFKVSDTLHAETFACPDAETRASWMNSLQNAADVQKLTVIGAHIDDEYFEKMILMKVPQVTLINPNEVQKSLRSTREKENPKEEPRSLRTTREKDKSVNEEEKDIPTRPTKGLTAQTTAPSQLAQVGANGKTVSYKEWAAAQKTPLNKPAVMSASMKAASPIAQTTVPSNNFSAPTAEVSITEPGSEFDENAEFDEEVDFDSQYVEASYADDGGSYYEQEDPNFAYYGYNDYGAEQTYQGIPEEQEYYPSPADEQGYTEPYDNGAYVETMKASASLKKAPPVPPKSTKPKVPAAPAAPLAPAAPAAPASPLSTTKSGGSLLDELQKKKATLQKVRASRSSVAPPKSADGAPSRASVAKPVAGNASLEDELRVRLAKIGKITQKEEAPRGMKTSVESMFES
eukprot:TRINITY_DN2762_c0_g1_i1.p1 TRINITY_DN2762_c0_g1~~TRINITY_DN2762_c0_g1_i1.p1  ORF type:complete len:749 (-),score=208.95 TRINITY_DN2762_c0_g1_i1:33-2078(-)